MLTSEGVDGLNKIKKKRSSTDTSNNSDCRAVPRSENVVLQKSIDHIQELLDEQAVLISRLSVARTRAAGHPLLDVRGKGEIPLWEREWTGGKKLIKEEDDEDDD